MTDPATLTLTEAARAVRDGALRAEALADACLDRVARLNPTLNAFLSVEAEEALAAARRADAEIRAGRLRGPLHGVPLAHKDMFHRAGKPCTCGSPIRRGFRPERTATVLERLDAAGAVTLGTLHMAEFAMGPTGHNAHLGRCRNPWDPDRITGGSSSGSGAAVAARLAFGSLGSDTGGSVRLPAALCGVVGLKPTQGATPMDGVMPLSESLDCVGPLARSAEDAATLFSLITGRTDAAEGIGQGVEGLRLGIPNRFYCDGLDPAVAAALEQARAVLERAGARFVEVDIPDHEPYGDLANLVFTPEAAAIHAPWLRERPQDYGPQVRARLLQGLMVPAATYLQAKQLRALHLRAMIDGPFTQCDALFVPALRSRVPTAAQTDVGAGPAMAAVVAGVAALTRPVSYLGLPALVTPAGFDPDGMPVALQLIGRPHAEATLLRIADAHERAAGWLRRVPKTQVFS
ncbi:amidase [Roseomonas genomospecies 6]|uniref:Amidase n=1 Tax=Roseomonas genomospecies 6 TaxID=214106 RepID=A0A9W7KQ38_9PROT|nr:amidase [Roseomonas genomospecies 6]KAA0677263.1 amidase [Roseomonas genomospecies 6]